VAVVVQKFGGSSVKDAERVMEAARKAIRAKRAGNHVIVVVSAQGSTTDDLIAKAAEITDEPNAREMDMLLATGEQISIALTAMAIHECGGPSSEAWAIRLWRRFGRSVRHLGWRWGLSGGHGRVSSSQIRPRLALTNAPHHGTDR
jgi:hypothetical protein